MRTEGGENVSLIMKEVEAKVVKVKDEISEEKKIKDVKARLNNDNNWSSTAFTSRSCCLVDQVKPQALSDLFGGLEIVPSPVREVSGLN